MKMLLTLLFGLIPFLAGAQDYQGFNQADIGKMMQQAEILQQCMDKVDKAELDAIDRRSEELEAKLKALCEAGKRDEAQNTAVAFGKEILANPALVQMKKCGDLTQEMLPPEQRQPSEYDFDFSQNHVCDE
ncbi:MAG: hypothetical protein KJ950_10730 [Proteobacteria bacterium]|nr:hypothetical protein [Pseudomonadota bacterium]MBU1687461.1 hypothetical protein [Pseudomonadota bacterium]